MNLSSMSETRIPVTDRTPFFLDQRSDDDFRLAFILDLMYGDTLPGQPEENGRFVEMVGEASPNPIKMEFRKAKLHDTIQYNRATSITDMKVDIEKNISNIAKLKAVGAGLSGCPPIKNIWVVIYTQNPDGEIHPNIYFNPSANDCGDILRTDKEIIMASIVITYEIQPVDKNNGGVPDEIYEWIFVSPVEESIFDEIEGCLIKEEAELYEHMFNIEFDADEVITAFRAKRKAESDRKAFDDKKNEENNILVMPSSSK